MIYDGDSMRKQKSHGILAMNKVKNGILLIAGGLTLALGMLGIILPILPTTPFLLLSATCFLKSSERAHRWLMTNRILGPYIYQYKVTKKLRKKAKYRGLFFLWGSILLSSFLIGKILVGILLFVIATAVTLHLMSFDTMSEEDYRSFMEEYARYLSSGEKELS